MSSLVNWGSAVHHASPHTVAGVVKQGADISSISEILAPLLVYLLAHSKEFILRSRCKGELVSPGAVKEYLSQLLPVVVLKIDVSGKAGVQPGIAVDKPPHLVGIARHNDDQVFPVILHCLKQGVDGLLPEVRIGACGAEYRPRR